MRFSSGRVINRIYRHLMVSALTLLASLLATSGAQASLVFSDATSKDSMPVTVLTAVVTFEVAGSELHIDILNQSAYDIARVYFNTGGTLTGLESTNSVWKVGGSGSLQAEEAEPFGLFNWVLNLNGSPLAAGASDSYTLNMTGTTTAETIESERSISDETHQQVAFAAIRFVGPKRYKAFGASGAITATPEPSTLILVAFGTALGLVGYGWRRKRQVD